MKSYTLTAILLLTSISANATNNHCEQLFLAQENRSSDEIAERYAKLQNTRNARDQFSELNGLDGTRLYTERYNPLTVETHLLPFLLLSIDRLTQLPKDTVVWGIDGKKAIVGKDKIDLDHRDGWSGYGLRPQKFDSQGEFL